jgi:hypothetical protein
MLILRRKAFVHHHDNTTTVIHESEEKLDAKSGVLIVKPDIQFQTRSGEWSVQITSETGESFATMGLPISATSNAVLVVVNQ